MTKGKRKLQCYPSKESWNIIDSSREYPDERVGRVIDRLIQGSTQKVSNNDTSAALEARVKALEDEISIIRSRQSLSKVSKRVSTPIPVPDLALKDGISRPQLCYKFNLGRSQDLSRRAKRAGHDSPKAYLEAKTGWHYHRGLWYPPQDKEGGK